MNDMRIRATQIIKGMVFFYVLLLGAGFNSVVRGDSSSFTPSDVSSLPLAGGGLPTVTDTKEISASVPTDSGSWTDSKTVNLGSHEVCLLTEVAGEGRNHHDYSGSLQTGSMCEVYKSGGEFYLSGSVKATWEDEHDAFFNCEAMCYD